MDPIRPVTRDIPPVPPVRRRTLEEDERERERRERQRRRHDSSAPEDEPPSGDEGDGPMIDVRA